VLFWPRRVLPIVQGFIASLLCVPLGASATGSVTVIARDTPLDEVLAKVEEQSGVRFALTSPRFANVPVTGSARGLRAYLAVSKLLMNVGYVLELEEDGSYQLTLLDSGDGRMAATSAAPGTLPGPSIDRDQTPSRSGEKHGFQEIVSLEVLFPDGESRARSSDIQQVSVFEAAGPAGSDVAILVPEVVSPEGESSQAHSTDIQQVRVFEVAGPAGSDVAILVPEVQFPEGESRTPPSADIQQVRVFEVAGPAGSDVAVLVPLPEPSTAPYRRLISPERGFERD
jgi:hypothetical protein